MDIEDIEEEVYDFVDNFFLEYVDIIEYELDFIEQNNLITPRENYLILFDFLNNLVVSFRNLDYTKVDDILKKLYLDINNIHKLYNDIDADKENLKDIFNNKVLKESKIIEPYVQEFLRLKAVENMNSVDTKTLSKLSKDLKKFKSIYFKIFYDIFLEQREDIYQNIAYILNSKLFYLDKLIWLETSASLSVQRHYKTIGLEVDNINSKKYISKKLSTLKPQTLEYDYLKECLRIYK